MSLKPCENCGKEVPQRYTSKYTPNHWLCQDCRDKETDPKFSEALANLIVTTTPTVEGKKIVQYIDIIIVESIQGVGMFKDFGAGFVDAFGGAATGYQKALDQMKEVALKRLREKAHNLGANAVVGVDLDYGELRGTMLMLVVNGTAVKVE